MKTRKHDEQTVVITGASRGIGRATALEIAIAGANVVATARSCAERATLVAVHPNIDDDMPNPPPPTYAPEVVARAIRRAAVHPTREVPVGGAAAGFVIGQQFSPALTDALMSIPRLGFATQLTNNLDNNRDNVDEPMSGTGRTHGANEGRAWHHSAFTAVVGHRHRVGEVVGGAVNGIR